MPIAPFIRPRTIARRPGRLAALWFALLSTPLAATALANESIVLADPLQVEALHPPRLGQWLPEGELRCADMPLGVTPSSPAHYPVAATAPGLADVVERSLCRNPQTMQTWAQARAQVAQIGVAKGAFLPTVQASLTASQQQLAGQGRQQNQAHQATAGATLGWLIADGGARDAALEEARQLLAAAAATQDQTVLTLFFSTIQGYHQAQATQALLLARRAAETASQATLEVSTARYLAGSATPADRLQAQTAYSQARLLRLRAEGELRVAWGRLASLMGESPDYFDPWANRWLTSMAGIPPPTTECTHHACSAPNFTTSASLANLTVFALPPSPATPDADAADRLDALLATALQHRPDLAAAKALWQAAIATATAARASLRPSISLSAGTQWGDASGLTQGSANLGITAVFPLFSGHVPTYRIAAATAQAEARAAQIEALQRNIGEEVWRARLNLDTTRQAHQASADLLTSAQAAAAVALGRYRAGVGTVLDLLNAQSALASAHQQRVSTALDWQLARSQLAQSLGQFDPRLLDAPQGMAPGAPASTPLTPRSESPSP